MNSGMSVSKFYRNQLVEVRSSDEILQTLDSEGKLDGLPFMPEMAAYCGTQIRVHRRSDRTCVAGMGFRRMKSAVFLQDLRCDGGYHDGCQRGCLFFWKEAWLMPAEERARPPAVAPLNARATEVLRSLPTRRADGYVCQSTELAGATFGQISNWDVRPFLRDMRNGELSVREFLTIVWSVLLKRSVGWDRNKVPTGPKGKKTKGDLALDQGEWVRVKSADEIREHLDPNGQNCGLGFRPTMNVAIGGRYRVAFPIQRIISEQTGKMAHLSSTVALKGVTCQGQCAANCPRDEYLYWRESWLNRAAAEE